MLSANNCKQDQLQDNCPYYLGLWNKSNAPITVMSILICFQHTFVNDIYCYTSCNTWPYLHTNKDMWSLIMPKCLFTYQYTSISDWSMQMSIRISNSVKILLCAVLNISLDIHLNFRYIVTLGIGASYDNNKYIHKTYSGHR